MNDHDLARQHAPDEEEDDEPKPDTSPWLICPTCHGDGHHCQHLGAITEEDRERDWDADSWEDYMNGVYDRICETCKGSGKVRTDTLNRILEEAADYRSEQWAKPAIPNVKEKV